MYDAQFRYNMNAPRFTRCVSIDDKNTQKNSNAIAISHSHSYKQMESKGGNIMKTKEELNVLKAEVEKLNKKLAELTDEELAQVAGGTEPSPENSDSVISRSEGTVWLKENSGNTGAWYGLDNDERIFTPGSRFYIDWKEKQ